ncbi:MAG: PKD domain-containing protein, partial [Bacteroidetes bacterium]|nr:PKD domain-containing protein [Bacteroidota bacterium]
NSNIYASLNQNLSDCYLYHFNAKIENSVFGTSQRRFGFHFFSDNASLANRGNSYFIYFRNELSTLEFYKVVNDTYTQTNVINNIITTPGQLYDFKVIYNKTTGKIDIYRNNILLGSWTDSSPYTTNGNFISFRTGNCKATIDNIKVYRSRNSSAILTVGAAGTNDIRYQNTDSTTFSAKIFSIVTDLALNISPISEKDINIDWTPSSTIIKVNDGTSATDIDNTNIHTTISANWSKSIDVNSKINHYSYCFGTTPGGTDLIAWTNNGMDTVVTISGINLQNGTTYYCSVKAEDGAGLVSNIAISDGIAIKYMADFYAQDTVVCEGDAVNFINTSVNSSNYLWTFAGGTPSTSASVNPMVIYNTTGNYDVKLYTTGSSGSDSLIKLQYITVNPKAHANFTVSDTIVSLPSANVVFVNTSTNATSYLWNFGDGGASAQNNPWHSYNLSGKYTITLIAYNNSCGNDTLVSDTLIRVSGLGISEINTVNNLTVFPNPSSGNLTISFDLQKSDYVEICIFDKAGRQIVLLSKGKIMQGKFRTEIYTNNIGISSGTYLLGIKEGKKIYYTEIVIL